ncbi:MAG: class I SAM-dependent methyltransferase [Treponema sp.]|jgi:2-polyprenyl-3-methyl-5-hydroxy-6-metoxy-1,4-benzoquinol methylase|nr:class I SAM-dependent methyltransferase [Treponema sp.]
MMRSKENLLETKLPPYSQMVSGAILIVPCTEKGCGGGHLVRSAVLTSDLRKNGREAFLYTGEQISDPGRVSSILALVEGFDASWACSAPPPQTSLLIIDGFRTSKEGFEKWSRIAPLAGIDEGGDFRERFDFLIDLLPGIHGRPNLMVPAFLPLPQKRRSAFSLAQNTLRILVSFGAEDAAGLGLAAAGALGVSSPQKIPQLREHLAEYDLIITHFGITAFEALHARVPVLLVSPGPYHEKLAKKAGFVSAGIGKAAARRLGRIVYRQNRKTGRPEPDMIFFNKLALRSEILAKKYGLSGSGNVSGLSQALGDYLVSAHPQVSCQCRACGFHGKHTEPAKALARFPERTYRCCKKCGLINMDRLTRPPIEYDKDYFFDFYKKQYGKTYLEDFPSLAEAGKRRLLNIKPLLGNSAKKSKAQFERPRILDIGCAYGPFLAAAREEGFVPEGIEAAEDAARYVREELGIPCKHGFFTPDKNTGGAANKNVFDAVTLWYVIEHFENPAAMLKEINLILKDGGVLAFSTPSFSGVSGRKSLDKFLKNSPADHWTVWRPGICKKILKKHGFILKKLVVTGHHPERFPLVGRLLKKSGVFYGLCMIISRVFRLGDSFEAYAVKENQKNISSSC